MRLSTVHLIFLFLTLLVTIVPGLLLARRIKSAEDYSLGGRHAGMGMVAGAIIGTIVGGGATVGTAQLAFAIGISAWWFTLGSGLSFILMGLFYAVPLRKSGLTTISEFLVTNYGISAGCFASISSSIGIFFSIVASGLTAIHLVEALFGIGFFATAVIFLVIVLALVFFGGLAGGGLAGIIKLVFVYLAIFVGGAVAYGKLGGLAGMEITFPAMPWLSLFGTGIEGALARIAALLVGIVSTQTYIQAIFSACDSKAAAKGCFLAAALTIPVGLPSVAIGMFMRANHPELASVNALPIFLADYLPPWLGGIGLATLMLSAFGSIAGLSLGIGTMLSRDLAHILGDKLSNRGQLACNRFIVLLVILGSILFIFEHLHSSVLGWNYLSMGLRGSGIFLPLTFCVFFPNKIHRRLGRYSIACGVFTACLWELTEPVSVNSIYPALLVNLIFLLAGLYLGNSKEEPQAPEP